MKENSLYFAKIRPEAIIPSKKDEDAGYDIYACVDKDIVIEPHETKLIPTGIAAAVSEGYYLQVQERGSTGSKGMKYGAGVIDSGYRGEIFIAISNVNDCPILISSPENCEKFNHLGQGIGYPKNKAIAQLIVHNVPKMDVEEISYEDLQNIASTRGTGSLGSSNK